jgi:hypothetical protein
MGFIKRARLAKTVYAGSSCTGTDGTANRTLVHSKALLSDSLVINGRAVLISGAGNDYTVSGTTITFLGVIFDTDTIMVVA